MLTGNGGNNVLRGGLGADLLDGDTGGDTADYSDKTSAVSVTLNGATSVSVKVNSVVEDTIRNIENLIGGTNSDSFTGDNLANRLEGGAGNDTLKGVGGDDALKGGVGKDSLDGGIGIDTADYGDKTLTVSVALNGAISAVVTVNGVAEDTLRNIENVTGGSGNDTLIGDGLANVLRGGLGADVLDGGIGIDTADYGDKTLALAVTLNGATNASVKVNGVIEDALRNIENVTGGSGADVLIGDGLANTLRGGLGADVLDGGVGIDTADYGDKTVAVSVALRGATNAVVKVNGVAEDVLRNIENVTGGSGNDTLFGDGLANTLVGGAGNDLLRGGLGTDVLDGGGGIDTADYGDKTLAVSVALRGATNAVVKVDGLAEDTVRNVENVTGGSGNDTLFGDGLANTLVGGAGNDLLRGGLGADVLDGGVGIDTADYGDKTLTVSVALRGATNAVVKVNGVAEDVLRNIENVTGGSGNDTLFGDGLANTLVGGAGNDLLRGGLGADMLDGGIGTDTADYGDKTHAVEVTLRGATNAVVNVNGVAEDVLRSIENVTGGADNDRLFGDGLANVFRGGLGADVLDGGVGIDTADYGDKTLGVSVALNGATNAEVKVNGVAEDVLRNIENVTGGSGNDTLFGDGFSNTLVGGAGDDLLRGDLGADVLDGGIGIDTADYGDKTLTVSVALNGATNAVVNVNGVGEDVLRNIENVTGGSGNDTLTGDGLGNTLVGGAGNDRLNGGAGDDTLRGGLGNDVLDGGAGVDTADYSDKTGPTALVLKLSGDVASSVFVNGVAEDTIRNIENLVGALGNDMLFGDALANRLEGGDGDDYLTGAGGKDVLDGGAGVDMADYSEKTLSVSVTLKGSESTSVWIGGVAEDTIQNVETVAGGSSNDVLTGDDTANFLIGVGGDDILDGGAGNDQLMGGAGKDTLNGGSGVDTADFRDKTFAVSVTLSTSGNAIVKVDGIEEDTIYAIESVISGSANDVVTGNHLANMLDGNWGDDVLNGGAGDDVLVGGNGNDRLTGGLGKDNFVFHQPLTSAHMDVITDFNVGDDTIHLENGFFTELPAIGVLTSSAFFVGVAAHNANDRIADRYAHTKDWRPLAYWIHDHLPYSRLQFFPKLAAFNINWHDRPKRSIFGFADPKGYLLRGGEPDDRFKDQYRDFPEFRRG